MEVVDEWIYCVLQNRARTILRVRLKTQGIILLYIIYCEPVSFGTSTYGWRSIILKINRQKLGHKV